jgi:hypothetical protein
MFSNNRDELRKFYVDSWQKFLQQQALSPLEAQVVAVVKEHPEYHAILENTQGLQGEYFPELGETNPFLHMGMHLGLREQLSTNRPEGIGALYKTLVLKHGQHEAEHEMMDCLAEAIWSAQKNNTLPDDIQYLACLKKKTEAGKK